MIPFVYQYSSPVGLLEISGNENGIESILYDSGNNHTGTTVQGLLKECIEQLNEYFAGKRKVFDLPLNPQGTDFQKRVWTELQKIPYGKTVSYLDIARNIGDANSTRAVGNANGKNKLNIIIPCHRVIGINGKLTGYGGGLWRKQWLLELEMENSHVGLFGN